MKIIRGNKEYELTSHELYEAYCEQQFLFDREDIEDFFDGMDDRVEHYGVTRDEVDGLLDEMAEELRRVINTYGLSWEEARYEAISNVVSEYKEDKYGEEN